MWIKIHKNGKSFFSFLLNASTVSVFLFLFTPATAYSQSGNNPIGYSKDNVHYLRAQRSVVMLKQIQSLSDPEKDEQTVVYMHGNSLNYRLARPFLREIYMEGAEALPALVPLIDDTSYLYSELYYGSLGLDEKPTMPHTIGKTAQELFLNIVDPVIVSPCYKSYRNSFRSKIPANPIAAFPGKMSLREWWEENQDKTFEQQRQMVLNYYIVHVEEVCKKLESDKKYESLLERTKELLNDLKKMKVPPFQIDPELYNDIDDYFPKAKLLDKQTVKFRYGENLVPF